jgi:translation elongation factor EF-Tu-like GTPase
MPKLLSVVEDVFQISGRGSVVVVPGIPREGDWHIKTGDPLTLKRPDGTAASTVVRGIEMASPPHPHFIPILLGLRLTKDDVPIGTELWVS